MNSKAIIKSALLLFVVASLGYLMVNEARGKTKAAPPPAPDTAAVTQEQTQPAKVIAYYFHGNKRCTTCMAIEACTAQAIKAGFTDALNDGRLEWRVINVEEPGNAHFVDDFQLTTRSVVLERTTNGKRQAWKSLERVWDLVNGEQDVFSQYIQDETKSFLEMSAS